MAEPTLHMQPAHWAIVRNALRDHVPDYEVWAFGSRAKGNPKPYSDLDLAIITPQPMSLAQGAALAEAFAESDLPWRVDIVDWATIDAGFRRIIERDRVVLQHARP